MTYSLRLIPAVFRLTSLMACLVSIAAGATLPLTTNVDGARNRVRFIYRSAGDPIEPERVTTFSKWNVIDKQLPLLNLPGDRLKQGFDQSLSFPLDQFRFPIFQALSYDDEHGRYLLPTISTEGKGVHFIEFVASEIKSTFTSTEGDIKLIDNDNLKTIRTADGTKYSFVRYPDGEFRCAGIKDPQSTYLSLLYTANGLTLHGLVDSSGRTVTFNYSRDGITSVTQNWMANSEGISKTWMVGESLAAVPVGESIFASPSVAYSRTNEFTGIKALPTNAVVRAYSPEMAASDKVLAQIFGGPTAVAAGNGFEPAGLAASYPLYRGDIIGDDGRLRRGHLSFAMHLYGNYDGTADSALYVPPGFTSYCGPPSPTDAVVTFYYPHLGNLTDVTLAVFHVANFQISKEEGRVRIGSLGGPGGASAYYKHTHIEFYRGNTGLPALAARPHLRIDPATVFPNVTDGR
jgi:hypothetical protein